MFSRDINCQKFLSLSKIAFTLSEVLIALVVIGVIAAITVPYLVNNYQKQQAVVQLKKVYSELAQAVEMSEVTNGLKANWDFCMTSYEFFNKYLKSYVKMSETTVGNSDVIYYQTSGSRETGLLAARDTSHIITLTSGTQIFAYDEAHSLNNLNQKGFIVDINGFKKPNRFGRDLFYLVIHQKLGVIPHYWDDGEDPLEIKKTRNELINGSSNESYQCNKKKRGMWCAALIMTDNWQMKDDYPW